MTATYGDLLWQPDRERQSKSALTQFAKEVGILESENGRLDFGDLHHWSINHPEEFWGHAAEFLKIDFHSRPNSIYKKPPAGKMLGAQWFLGSRLNYAENLLSGVSRVKNQDQVLIGYAEGTERRVWSSRDIHQQTGFCQRALTKIGLKKGEPVGAVIANIPEAVIAMLGVTSLGGVWSSCSPDFGVEAVVDRLRQLNPKILFATREFCYGGRAFDCSEKIRQVLVQMPSVETVIWIDHLGRPEGSITNDKLDERDEVGKGHWTWQAWMEWGRSLGGHQVSETPPLTFVSCAAEDPLFVMFSSGTTGLPKCIVHSVLGTLLQHKKEHQLHCNMHAEDRLLYFTTCGWMMWNWMVSALASGTSLVLFEGSVQHEGSPGSSVQVSDLLWRVVAREGVTVFGTSPKYLSFCMNLNLSPSSQITNFSLSKLNAILSTGSPLLPEHFDWVYGKVSARVHLASISGGTDIISCFMLGNPWSPVYSGEIQGPGLGMAIEAWSESGQPLVGEKGELVCTKPFPSMPIGFWNDPDQVKFKQAYFEYFQGKEVWRHGDFVEITPRLTVIVYGRSDATLNPGGIRIGSAEIYRQVESMEEIEDSVVVGIREKEDTPMVLFVIMAKGFRFSPELDQKIKKRLRTHLTPRHVPKTIVQAPAIPYTRSGKKVELAVMQAIHGDLIANLNSLANPDALEFYQGWGRDRQ
jgi:acetoacetyl-CoA synthetase